MNQQYSVLYRGLHLDTFFRFTANGIITTDLGERLRQLTHSLLNKMYIFCFYINIYVKC